MDRPNIQIRKILRSPSVKRKNKTVPVSERVTLERVLGLSVSNNAALATDPATGTIAYPAGCVIILYNPKKGKQTHIFNTSKKTLTCLAFSGDGKHLVSGETGHQPAVRVWDLEERSQVAEFYAHKYGIVCVAFSPNLKYILSVGAEHDMLVNVWNWKSGIKVASNKVASKVTDVAFSEDSSMFVTVGNRHVKFWYLDASKSKIKTETVPLMGRNGILGEHQNNFFCGVCCGKGDRANTVFAITESGLLCEFNDKRLLSKWVLLRTDCANAITASDRYIFVGCANGLVRIFSSATLNFVTTMPAPHHLGVDVACGVSPGNIGTLPKNARYPDTVALRYSDIDCRLTCVYNDHSLYIWDVTDIRKVGKTRSFLFHSGAVWGIDAPCYDSGDHYRSLPVGSFVTCSSDNTIRVWNCDLHVPTDRSSFKRNIYSNELLKILYLDPDLNNLLDIAYNPAGKKDKTDTGFQEKNGIRCVRLNPNGLHLASGDRAGNVRVHELHSMKQIAFLEAHDSEVLCLEYTKPSSGVQLLATASRDRLLHIFDMNHNYGLVQTLDDHSSAITAIRFTELDGQPMMMSCGVDKSLLFRNVNMDPDFHFVLNRHMVSRTTLYDMEVDLSGKFVATACQDRNIRIYSTRNGKQKKCYSGSTSNDGTLLRLELDPSNNYVATSSSDKSLSVYDFFSGECVATMFGHSEISTGIKFLDDLKHFISVSVDGCIFVWRLPPELTEHIRDRLTSIQTSLQSLSSSFVAESSARRETFIVPDKKKNKDSNDNFPPTTLPDTPDTVSPRLDYRFSVGQLPSWAKRQVLQESYVKTPAGSGMAGGNALPKGRWASRVEDTSLIVKSLRDTNSMQDLKLFSEDASSTVSSSSDPRSKVSFITDDDENNRDDDFDDEFKATEKNRIQQAADVTALALDAETSSQPAAANETFVLSRHSSVSADDEDEDGTESKETTVYYLPSNDNELDPNFDSTFKVFEGAVGKFSGPDCADDDEDEAVKSPSSPSSGHKDTLSDLSSVDDEKRDQFGENVMSHEKFDNALTRLEEEAIDLNNDSPGHCIGSRQSISALFLSRSLMPSHSRTMFKGPSQLLERSRDLFSRIGERKTTVENRDTNTQPRELSSALAGSSSAVGRKARLGSTDGKPSITFREPPKSPDHQRWVGSSLVDVQSPPRRWKSMFDVTGAAGAGKSLSTANTLLSPAKSSRTKTPTLTIAGKIGSSRRTSSPSPLRYVASTDLKLEPTSSSTLPRATRNSKGSRQSMSALVDSNSGTDRSSGHSTDTVETSKRRSAAHSYRMQTESSMAKLASNKDAVSDVKKKEMLMMAMRFPSTPNLPAEVKTDDEETVDTESADKTLVANDDDLFMKPAWPVRRSEPGVSRKDSTKLHTVQYNDNNSTGQTVGSNEVSTRTAPVAVPARTFEGPDRALMPPPLSTSVPSSIQASFIAKAAKHRRTTMPESLAQSRDTLSASVGTRGYGILETSGGVVADEGDTQVSAANLTGAGKQNLVASPLEPPERDVGVLHNQVDVQTGLRIPVRNSTDQVTSQIGHSSQPPPALTDAHMLGPKVVKIGRCTSPLRPFVMKTTKQTDVDATVISQHGSQESSPLVSRRQLPASPRLSETSRSTKTSVDWRSSSGVSSSHLPSTTSGLLPSVQVTSSSAAFSPSAASIAAENCESLSSSLDSRLVGTVYSGRPSTGNSPRSVETVNHSNSLASYITSSDAADMTQTWMKQPQQMQHQWEQRQQPTAEVMSTKNETTLSPQFLANSERSKTETLIHEIERYCEERRWSKDRKRPDHPHVDKHDPEASAADNKNSRNSSGHSSEELHLDSRTSIIVADSRQQWEKAKQVKPFAVSSLPSSSTYMRSHSSVLSDGVMLTSVPSLSRQNMFSSTSSLHSADDTTAGSHQPACLTNPRHSNVRASTAPADTVGSVHSRRSRPLSRSGVPSAYEKPSEGEPDRIDVLQPRELDSTVLSTSMCDHDDVLTTSSAQPAARPGEAQLAARPAEKSSVLTNDVTYPSVEHCSKLASDLTQAVTRATDLYCQLNDGSEVSGEPGRQGTHARALRLLHESLSDARTLLTKSLGVSDDKSSLSTSTAAGSASDTTMHMMEAMLERYSQQLSSQVYELFKQKLDELQTATKL